MPEVEEIQELQQAPPAVLFRRAWWGGLVLGIVLPFLAGTGLLRRVARPVFTRFANGVTTVRLEEVA